MLAKPGLLCDPWGEGRAVIRAGPKLKEALRVSRAGERT